MISQGTKDGKFSCKSAYEALRNVGTGDSEWGWIWRMKIPNKLKAFTWLVQHGSLMTNALRFDRHLSDSAHCNRCNHVREDVEHVLKGCMHAKTVWDNIMHENEGTKFYTIPNADWIRNNIRARLRVKPDIGCSWGSVFMVTCWHIWKARNLEVFQGKKESAAETVRKIIMLAIDIDETLMKPSPRRVPKPKCKWSKPSPGWVKLNTDGSVIKYSKMAAAGGVVRDENGCWIGGLSMKLGKVSILLAELLGLREGLRVAWEFRFRRIVAKCDSEEVVNLVKGGDVAWHPYGEVVKDCRRLLGMPWEAAIQHIYRAGNEKADVLAKMGHHIGDSLVIWKEEPPDVVGVV